MERVFVFINNNFKTTVVCLCVMIIVGVCFLSNFNDSGKVSASTSNQKYFICIEICEGDTLWTIADTYISEEYSSLEVYVDEIRELNGLTDDIIFSGATLVVPYYAP